MRILWDIGSVIGIYCLLYVMTRVKYWLVRDPKWFLNLRILAFILEAVLIAYSIGDYTWEPTVPDVLALYGAVLIIVFNAISLWLNVKEDRSNGAGSLDTD